MNAPIVPGARPLYRSVFISDTHLGTRGARCDFLADFLRRTTCQHLFLVGDIIDGWRLKKSWYWPALHNDIVWRVMKRAKRGTRVIENVDRSVEAGGGRFTFDYPAFAATAAVNLDLVGRVKTISCLIPQSVLTQLR